MSTFPPADLFAAVALAAQGDSDLPDGVHLRLMPSPALGFPIAPFGIYRVTPFVVTPQVIWRDRRGNVIAEPAFTAAGGVLIGDILAPSADGTSQDVGVELITDGPFDGTLVLIDRVGNRVFAQRSRAPFIVGGPRVERVRIEGRGRVVGLRTWRVDLQRLVEALLHQAPDALLSLPIDGLWPWYANGRGSAAALERVERGAALRLQRPDRPDGPFDPLTPADDVTRVSAHATHIDQQCKSMVGDITVMPTQQRLVRHVPATPTRRRQFVDISIASTLLAQAMDPAIGRYLGLVGTLDERTDGTLPLAYVAIGLFVFPRIALAPDGRTIIASLGSRSPMVDQLADAFVARIGAKDVLYRLNEQYGTGRSLFQRLRGIEMRGLLAVAGAVPAADPPAVAAPALANARWLDGGGRPSTTFRQEFLFPAPPLGSLVALGRLENGVWRTRHQMIDLAAPANPARRALAMLMGRTQAKPKLASVSAVLGSYMRRGLISDAPIRASNNSATYRAALADLFGRFGPPAQFDVPAPPRPKPPTPAPQAKLILDGPDGVDGPPASPGHIDVSVSVPSVARLAAGSLDIGTLKLTFEGNPVVPDTAIAPVPAGAVQDVTRRIDLRKLDVGVSAVGVLQATFIDTAGNASDVAEVSIRYGDRRRPTVVPTGLGLIWTSRPGPSPEVELKLSWPATGNAQYRVYIADQQSLGVTGNSRAEVAVNGGQRDRAGTLGGRERFRLLTEPPLNAVGGRVTLNEHLPRSLTTVQFLRVVPLTPQGREAEFDKCGVVPIAVPTDRATAPPRVHVTVDPATRMATITISAPGFDLVDLQASEPGLFNEPPDPAAKAPEFRLRRASGTVSDPVYAREVARGPLSVVRLDGNIVFQAEVADPVALDAFIRYSYWAEVRMPAERRLAPGIVEIPPADGVTPNIPAQIADVARPFSTFSAPATAIYVPPLPVPILADPIANVIVDGATVRASLAAPATPSASPKAVGTYRLRIWEQWGDLSIGPATEVELDGSALAWEGSPVTAADHPRPLKLRFVTIDPVGRESDMKRHDVP
jgi:hypothetical protein